MRKENRLQMFDVNFNTWRYVFCYDQYGEVILTDKKMKGLTGSNLEYFANRYSNFQFRVI